ncbi:MAG TPA: YgeY family selenium metabolism-linked hydrolase, partial [Clostridia bacterium]|nr:YgeY family selenium metabolism-linked hydrolase [Clostridia bacterium]
SVGEEACYNGDLIEGERFFPGWLMDPQADYIQKIKRRLNALHMNPQLTTYNFCTNGSHYAGEAGIQTIGFGPSREKLAHIVDEYVEIEQLKKAFVGYVGIMEALLKDEQK